MDENVKNDAKQVMLVQNADDGRLQAVTGVDRDGNIQTADPTDQNVASLLNVNTQDSALEAFFKKFMEQAQNPVHTGIFVMTENALNKLIRIDFDPEILENYRIDPSERLQTQEQRQFEPLDVTKIDLADMEKKGIRMEMCIRDSLHPDPIGRVYLPPDGRRVDVPPAEEQSHSVSSFPVRWFSYEFLHTRSPPGAWNVE